MKYLITGITGTLGQAVLKLILEESSAQVIGYSRDECKQASLSKNERVTLYLGDIRNKDRITEASRDVDIVFHFAALKHVDKLEENPEESILTNIVGTSNILHAQRVNKIKRIVFTGTDKSAYPINVYGMSKGIAERLVLRNPNNIVCRYGNVLGSRGSFLTTLVKSLKNENTAYVTDPNMTRFWISADDAASFVFKSAHGPGGLKIPPMKASSLSLLVTAVTNVLNIKAYKTQETGLRAGEKIHECLRTESEGEGVYSNNAPQFTEQQLVDLLTPILKGIE